jgi:hypothetical protein
VCAGAHADFAAGADGRGVVRRGHVVHA